MKTFVLLAILSIASTAWANQCYGDSECPYGCCAHSKLGNECKMLGKSGDVCDLEGQHLADGVCHCESGLTCQKIDLTGFSPIAASANPILEKYHYGMCGEGLLVG